MGASFGDLFKALQPQDPYQASNVSSPSGFTPTSAEDQAYTAANRPGYQQFGPSGQFQQPIYRSSYSNYVQPTSYYSPGYSMPPVYNPFNAYQTPADKAMVTEVQSTTNNGGEVGKAAGGSLQSSGIDTLLK